MPKTALCSDLGIEHPIFSVGFGPGAGAELVAAVSEAGGVGVLGGSPPKVLREAIAGVRRQTDRLFGANIIIAPQIDRSMIRERFETIIGERVPLLVLFAGDPAPYVDEAHANGVRVFIQVGSPEEARRAVAAGVDGVISQGWEAGGHVIARQAQFVNLPLIVDAVAPTPVLASGGIADGRGLAAALALGAQGVSLGTRFVASREAFIRDEYKERVAAARAGDTFYSEFLFDLGWPGVPHRALKSRAHAEWVDAGEPPSGDRPGEGDVHGVIETPSGEVDILRWSSFMMTPRFQGDVELGPMWAGESVGLVNEILPAAEIVRRIANEADETLVGLAGAAAIRDA